MKIHLKCDEVPLERLARGAIAPEGSEWVTRHVAGCRLCRDRLRIMLALERILSRDEVAVLPLAPAGRQVWKMLAVLALLMTSSLLLYLNRPPTGDPARWASYRAHPLFPLEVRGGESEGDLAEGLRAYGEGRYRDAIELLERYAENPEARLYRGISLYLTGHSLEAVGVLSPLTSPGSRQRPEALWFRAQAYLHLRQASLALSDLMAIEPGSRYYVTAQPLIRELRRNP